MIMYKDSIVDAARLYRIDLDVHVARGTMTVTQRDQLLAANEDFMQFVADL